MQTLAGEVAGGSVAIICLDTSSIFGNDLYCDTVALIRMLNSILAPRVVLVKSRMLAMHGRCFHQCRKFLALSEVQLRKLPTAVQVVFAVISCLASHI